MIFCLWLLYLYDIYRPYAHTNKSNPMCLYFWQAKTQQMLIFFVGCKKPNHKSIIRDRGESGWRELFGTRNSPHDFWGKIQWEWWFHKLGLCIWYQRKLAWKTYSIRFLHAACLKLHPCCRSRLAWAAWTCCVCILWPIRVSKNWSGMV